MLTCLHAFMLTLVHTVPQCNCTEPWCNCSGFLCGCLGPWCNCNRALARSIGFIDIFFTMPQAAKLSSVGGAFGGLRSAATMVGLRAPTSRMGAPECMYNTHVRYKNCTSATGAQRKTHHHHNEFEEVFSNSRHPDHLRM